MPRLLEILMVIADDDSEVARFILPQLSQMVNIHNMNSMGNMGVVCHRCTFSNFPRRVPPSRQTGQSLNNRKIQRLPHEHKPGGRYRA